MRGLLAGVACLALVGCGIGATGGGTPSAVANATPDARGVITYASYQVGVARDGDTIASMATRVGTTPEALSQRNGLPVDYRLRAGEVVVLPDDTPRMAETSGWSPDLAATAIETAPVTATPLGSVAGLAPGPATAAPPPENPFRNGQTEPLIDPIRHRVEAGETVYSIARLYGVSATALASWNGLGPDLAIRVDQELLIPIVSGANQISGTVGAVGTAPGQGTTVAPPPIAATPLPENMAPGATPESPGLGQFRTPPGGRLQAPVSGPVVKAYNPGGGPNRSEGIGFGVPAGTRVNAAGDGEVALVSDSLGGLGTIVLVRHADDLLTVYGRVTDVSVTRGQRISAGQAIGVVAPGDPAELHFEVRRGTESVDPGPYLGL